MTAVRRIGNEVKLADPTTRKPPTTFRIFQYGKIDTVKGTFLFDKKAAASVMDNWKDWGNRLTFDYEHKATKEDGKAGDGKSAGSCLLSLQADGLYATDVRWTPQASTELSDGEWLYFSPTFLSDEKTDRILDLINIALTNIPATKGMTPLVTASKAPRKPKMTIKKKTSASTAGATKKKVALAAPPAAPIAGPATPAETAGETEQAGGTGMDAEADQNAKVGKMKAAKKRLADAKLEMSLAQAEHDTVCKAMSEDVDEDANQEDESDDSDDDDVEDGDDDSDEDDSDDSDDTARLSDDSAEETKDDPSNELDEEDDVMPVKPKQKTPFPTKTAKLSFAEQALLQVTGETDLRRATGKLFAMGATQGKVETVARRADFQSLAKKHAKPGSLTPKMEKLGYDIFKRMGAEAAESFLTGLSVVATVDGTKKKPQLDATGSFGLTQVELDMCKRMGNSPEVFAKQKAANDARSERMRRGEE